LNLGQSAQDRQEEERNLVYGILVGTGNKKKLRLWHSARDRPEEETEFMTFCWE
jgi:hypothetical protein